MGPPLFYIAPFPFLCYTQANKHICTMAIVAR